MISGDHSWKVLDGQSLAGSHLRGSVFFGTSLVGCDLSRADMRDTVFHCADLSGANLRSSRTEGTDWYGCFFNEESRVPTEQIPSQDNFFEDYDHWCSMRAVVQGLAQGQLTNDEAAQRSADWSNALSIEIVAQVLDDMGHSELAKSLYIRSIEQRARAVSVRNLAALSTLEGAVAILSQHSALNSPEVDADLGFYLANLGRFDEAVDHLDRAISHGVRDANPYFLRGQIHQQDGRLKEARAHLEQAQLLDPGNPQISIYLAHLYLEHFGEARKAMRLVDQLMTTTEPHPEQIFPLASLLIRLGRCSDALSLLQRAKSTLQEPHFATFAQMEAAALLCLGKTSDALEIARTIDAPSIVRSKAFWKSGAQDEAIASLSGMPPSMDLAVWLEEMSCAREAYEVLCQLEPSIPVYVRLIPLATQVAPDQLEVHFKTLAALPGGQRVADLMNRGSSHDSSDRVAARNALRKGKTSSVLTSLGEAGGYQVGASTLLWKHGIAAVASGRLGRVLLTRWNRWQSVQPVKTPGWKKLRDLDENTKIWISDTAAPIEDLKNEVDPTPLRAYLEEQRDLPIWDLLSHGIAADLQDLMGSGVDAALRARIPDLARTLHHRFNLSAEQLGSLEQGALLEGFSPEYLVQMGSELHLTPLLPPAQKGPVAYNRAQWIMHCHMDWFTLFQSGRIQFQKNYEVHAEQDLGLVVLAVLRHHAMLSNHEPEQASAFLWQFMDKIQHGTVI